jgi:xylan 1,4-beta-xylosidase
MPYYKKMGSPVSPTRAQVEELNRDTAFQAPERRNLSEGNLTLDLGTNALALVKVHGK